MVLALIAGGLLSFVLLFGMASIRLWERFFGKTNIIFQEREMARIVKESVEKITKDTIRQQQTQKSIEGQQSLPMSEAQIEAELIAQRSKYIAEHLRTQYPDYVLPWIPDNTTKGQTDRNGWVLVTVGCAIGHMKVLHCSFSEYLIIYGTPMGTTGHSGLYGMDVYDFFFNGRADTYRAGQLQINSSVAGERSLLPRGVSWIYKAEPQTYMLEYGRGFPGVVLAVFYPMISCLFCTGDFKSFLPQAYVCMKHIFVNLFKNRKW